MSNDLKITIEPLLFDVHHLLSEGAKDGFPEPLPEFSLGANSPLFPDFPEAIVIDGTQFTYPAGLNVNLPRKVIIEIGSTTLGSFSWRQVQIPVTIAVSFTKAMPSEGLFMAFRDKSGRQDVKVVPVDPEAWKSPWRLVDVPKSVKLDRYHKPITTEFSFGSKDYWNMTYFTNLPKCSMSYDFWVTARGIDSEHKPFDIEFYVDGQKITQDNFEKMAEKYPALREEASK